MTIIQNILIGPDGSPAAKEHCVISLESGSTGGWVPGTSSEIIIQHDVTTDDDGLWSADLIGNLDILPAGTYYTVPAVQGSAGV